MGTSTFPQSRQVIARGDRIAHQALLHELSNADLLISDDFLTIGIDERTASDLSQTHKFTIDRKRVLDGLDLKAPKRYVAIPIPRKAPNSIGTPAFGSSSAILALVTGLLTAFCG